MNFDFKFSFIFPIHNEEKILKKQITFFIDYLKKTRIKDYEIILMENGSNDNSFKLIINLAKEYSEIKVYNLSKASYGLAIKTALLLARGQYLFILDLDFYNLNFLEAGIGLIKYYQLIVASKSLIKDLDKRPFKDRLRTKVFQLITKHVFKYPGTDTHGNKIIKNSILLKKTIYSCFTKYEFFDTELLIRLMKTKKIKLKELATISKEIRSSRYSFFRRYKLCLYDLIRFASGFVFLDKKYEKNTISFLKINADDYGLSDNTDQIMLDQRAASSFYRISILANMLSKKSILNLIKLIKDENCDLNLHFNLLRGKPISQTNSVSSLVNKDGEFFSLPQFLLKLFLLKINLEEVEKELNQQFSYLKKNNIYCTGVDSEQHLHIFHPIWSIVIRFAKKNNLHVRSQKSTFYHLKKNPLKYLFCYFTRFIFLKTFFKIKDIPSVQIYDAIIVHPGSNYD